MLLHNLLKNDKQGRSGCIFLRGQLVGVPALPRRLFRELKKTKALEAYKRNIGTISFSQRGTAWACRNREQRLTLSTFGKRTRKDEVPLLMTVHCLAFLSSEDWIYFDIKPCRPEKPIHRAEEFIVCWAKHFVPTIGHHKRLFGREASNVDCDSSRLRRARMWKNLGLRELNILIPWPLCGDHCGYNYRVSY